MSWYLLSVMWFGESGMPRTLQDLKTKCLSFYVVANGVHAGISLSGNLSKGKMAPSMSDFNIIKSFDIVGHAPKPYSTTQVIWHDPLLEWLKCNTDWASRGNPGRATGEEVFSGIPLAFSLVLLLISMGFHPPSWLSCLQQWKLLK